MTKKLIILFVAIGATCICQAQGTNHGYGMLTDTPTAAYTAQTPPLVALRTNLVYWAAIVPQVTPNAGIEFGLSKKMTFNLIGAYNPWNLNGSETNNKKLVHFIVEPEVRYWFCERFNGSAIGVHGIFSKFNIGGYKIPLLFSKNAKYTNSSGQTVILKPEEQRNEGWGAGAGVSYNYHWILSKHFGIEFSLGVGFIYMKYDKYKCATCDDFLGSYKNSYMGPTKIGINLIYVIK